jgi:hypothetical protein
MSKHVHEIRDPIHVFVRLDSDERAVLASRPFQRLRHLPVVDLDYVFIHPDLCSKALAWLKESRENVIEPPKGETT